MEDNLMMEMRAKYYPYHEQSKNLIETLDFIKDAMKRGQKYDEFYTFWTDLPDDWVIEWETVDKLKEQGFKIYKRWWDKGTNDEYFTIIIAWDKFDVQPNDEEYGDTEKSDNWYGYKKDWY